ncbi:universal stress protein [Nocardiopsis dassonvillei]|uniref:UspA domain protein n=2 Tax=Nocardiopsis TaxID=2013 RepID=D7B8Z8_NOCDD|nr:universal stress protein [Nocardiopsis dassonvillei]ADH70656.1 UspA domain protein [Nocardiopsis dassonvillei subsp. dassonvillei DSM 43111]APC33274.1 universal stress protein UspA [Nocardiopsis dassonvillei]NKY77931.1 universal stress protein [Nocardiopsis dassonvillei]VEI90865.1 Universal stress protein MSMEG_3950 [Nocardiopsis dassonvillei]
MNTQERPPAVVVGVDGTPASHAALVWATEEAARRGTQLRIVHGLGMPVVIGAYGAAGRVAVEDQREAGHDLLTAGAAYAHRARPGLDVVTVLAPEDAPAVLLNDALPEDVVVVGSRGLGGVRAIMLGSVSVRASSHAPCPVVVVPDQERPPPRRGRVVAGVDGSESSRRALRFALHEALVSGSEVVVVNSWEVPLPADTGSLAADARALHEEAFDRRSEEIVAGLLAEVVDERTEHLEISAVRTQANPVDALLEAGRDADLLVVGSRGRGGVRGLVMGSVSQGVLRHAPVPVAVLPPLSEDE